MLPAWPLANRIELAEILPYLSHGSVVGVYDDGSWVDWDGEPAEPLVVLSGYDLRCRPAGSPDHYHCVVHRGPRGLAFADLRGGLDALLRCSRGVALVTPRVGLLLAAAQRILAPLRERQPVPFRVRHDLVRSSGGWLLQANRPWQLMGPAEVARGAVLTLKPRNPVAAGQVLAAWPQVRLTDDLVHVTLDRGTPEEILERVRSAGIGVLASRVWYPALQTSPLEPAAIPH